jgi:hypothetical protein
MTTRAAAGAVILTLWATGQASADQAGSNLVGSWTWNEHGVPLREFRRQQGKQAAFSLLFRKDGVLDACVFMPNGLGEGAGEGLCSNGRHQLVKNRLIMTRDHVPADGWPSRDGNPPYRYACTITFSPDATSFRLEKCPISGTWLRDDHP